MIENEITELVETNITDKKITSRKKWCKAAVLLLAWIGMVIYPLFYNLIDPHHIIIGFIPILYGLLVLFFSCGVN